MTRNGIKIGVAILLLAGASLSIQQSWADVSSQGGGVVGAGSTPLKTVSLATGINNSAGSFGADSYILGWKLIATAANAKCGLVDAATLGVQTTSNTIDEMSEASQDETILHIWPYPYKLTTDLSVGCVGANVIIYYQ